MKYLFTVVLLTSYIGFSGLMIGDSFGGKCKPKGNCTACKNCTGCKNCAKDGGTCSVCK